MISIPRRGKAVIEGLKMMSDFSQVINFQIIMLTAGASFSAALTDKGSVIAWGNLRVIYC